MAKPGTTRVEKHIRSLFPDGVISRVQVLEYGDDPAVDRETSRSGSSFTGRTSRGAGKRTRRSSVHSRKPTARRLKRLNDKLPSVIAWVEFQADSLDGAEKRRRHVLKIGRGGRAAKPLDDAAEEVTPVMTRLGPADLATVDTLITAGIAGSRAEVLRWAVGRIRENPAYAQLQDRVREINELKARD